jgi:hypothetical protein
MTTIPHSDARETKFQKPPPGTDMQLRVAGLFATAKTSVPPAGRASSWHELTTVVGDRVVAGVGRVLARRDSEVDPIGIREQIWGRLLGGEDISDAVLSELQRSESNRALDLDVAYLSVEPHNREVRFVARGEGISALLLTAGDARPMEVPLEGEPRAASVEMPVGTTVLLAAHDPSWGTSLLATTSHIRDVELAGQEPESAVIGLCGRLTEVLHPSASVVSVHATPLERLPSAVPLDSRVPGTRVSSAALPPFVTQPARPQDDPSDLLLGHPETDHLQRRERVPSFAC